MPDYQRSTAADSRASLSSAFLTESNGWVRGGVMVVRAMRGAVAAGAGLGLAAGGEPSSGIFAAGRGGGGEGGESTDSNGASAGAGAGMTGWADCTTTVGVSTGGGAITIG